MQQQQQISRQPVQVPSQQMPNASSSRSAFPSVGPPTKRPVSPPPIEPVKKRAKRFVDNDIKCAVCQTSPTHLVKDCPVVQAGSRRFVDDFTTRHARSDVIFLVYHNRSNAWKISAGKVMLLKFSESSSEKPNSVKWRCKWIRRFGIWYSYSLTNLPYASPVVYHNFRW